MHALRAFALVSMALTSTELAAEAVIAPNETLVSPQADLQDAEYSQTRGLITWADSDGKLWVAKVNRSSGSFEPANGKGILIDSDAMKTADLKVVGNGPEWVTTSATDQIVYTKFLAGRRHTMANARLAYASRDAGGAWSYRFLTGNLRRNAPYASNDPGDDLPRISYVDPKGNHYWRNLFDGASEALVPWYPQSYRSMRFVRGARAVVFVAPVDGVSQVFRYWIDTAVLEQLTFDSGNKDLHSVPWMWQAPEFGNEFVLSTLVDDIELRIYRQLDPTAGGTGPWTRVHSARSPHGGMLNSPEPFTHDGRSYVFMAATIPPHSYPEAIFLSNIDAAQPMFRQLTPDAPVRMRHDPELFVTDEGPYIYFNRFDPAVAPKGPPNCTACSEGVYRTFTGLAPAVAP
jgi:hypothetical protein